MGTSNTCNQQARCDHSIKKGGYKKYNNKEVIIYFHILSGIPCNPVDQLLH